MSSAPEKQMTPPLQLSRLAGLLSFHSGEARIANQMFLQLGIQRALTAQPSEGTLGLTTQSQLVRRNLVNGCCCAFDSHFDQFRSWPNPRIHASRRHQFGLRARLSRKHFQNRDEIRFRDLLRFTAHYPADEASRETAPPCQLTLVELTIVRLPLQRHAEIAHQIFLVPVLHITQLSCELQSTFFRITTPLRTLSHSTTRKKKNAMP